MHENDWNEEDLGWIRDQEDMQNDNDFLGIVEDDDFEDDWDEDDWDDEEADWDYFDEEEDDYEDSEDIADEFLSLIENKKRGRISPLIQEAFNSHR